MCGLGALGILVFAWVGLLMAVVYGVALWWTVRRLAEWIKRRRRSGRSA